ncbi:MAG: hypothetical protein QOE56_1650 [Solirubrobacterales bacterium]|jgi:hypothetical protein|nr:hypothetical protein [Solirubrobacterales bacterium]
MTRLRRDERGTTLAELMVGLGIGMVVMLGLTSLIVVTLHSSTRVSARVDATQRARLALNQVLDQLHSACLVPKVAPILEKSTGTELRFVHAAGSTVSPTPTLSVISFAEGAMKQTDYAWKEGAAPFWVFQTTATKTTQLMDQITPVSASKPVFSYYASTGGGLGTPLATPLSTLDAIRTIQVSIVFKTAPQHGSAEEATPARIQGGATMRLTAAPSYKQEVQSLPCQ